MSKSRVLGFALLGLASSTFACEDLSLLDRQYKSAAGAAGSPSSTSASVASAPSTGGTDRIGSDGAGGNMGNATSAAQGGISGATHQDQGGSPMGGSPASVQGGTSVALTTQALTSGGTSMLSSNNASGMSALGGVAVGGSGAMPSSVVAAGAHVTTGGNATLGQAGTTNGSSYAGSASSIPSATRGGGGGFAGNALSHSGYAGWNGAATAGAAGVVTMATIPLCPAPISKSKALLAAEPTPDSPCARVTTALRHSEGTDCVFGFTNGEVHLASGSDPKSTRRIDTWQTSPEVHSLPRAIVTAMYAPRYNFDGALTIGYADSERTLANPWYAGRAGFSWLAVTRESSGTVLGITACPFHATSGHQLLIAPWAVEESSNSSYIFSTANHSMTQHLQLQAVGPVSTVEVIGTNNSWHVLAGTTTGEIYRSNTFLYAVTWSESTEQLSMPITWERITVNAMPDGWVTRIASNPAHPERLFALFGSDTDALWYSSDGGQSWSNRSAGLPSVSNAKLDPPIVGVTFNPFLDDAAYVVTSQTSYFTEDAGQSWHEW